MFCLLGKHPLGSKEEKMGWSTRRSDAKRFRPPRPGTAAALVVAAALVAVLILGASLATAPAASALSSTLSSNHGASFAVRCDFSHRLPDDPIVHFGHPGASHSHDFFGNRSTNARSGYKSLLAHGTTCSHVADKAAYWMPTVRWNGKTLNSRRAIFYYRAGGKDNTKVEAFRAGLKVVTDSHISWYCGGSGRGGKSTPPTRCSSKVLGVRIVFPDCSNGNLDSANHRSHMAYSRRSDRKVRCPASHPISVPVLTMNVTFPLPTAQGHATLSSGRARTMHADFFNAWHQPTLQHLVWRCIKTVRPSQQRPAECRA
jgi:hypothetical protein